MTSRAGNLLERLRRAVGPGLEIDRELGAGGMGVVFGGRDPVLDRAVAIKVLRPEMATAVSAERFIREGRVLARLDHPNIVRVHQAGESEGLFYLVMDRIEGERLSDRIAAGPLSPVTVQRLGVELLDALSTIHAAGVVHRDIKPSNLLFSGDRLMLTDFGIAHAADGAGELTVSGSESPLGTPAYMAPEQAMGFEATIQTDIWAVGASLYEAATGRRYDPGDADAWSGVPRVLAVPLAKALAIEPAHRWSDAGQFRAGLGSDSRRRLVGALAIAAGLIGVLAVALWPSTREPVQPALRRLAIATPVAAGRTAESVADSVTRALARRLSGYPDFEVVAAGGETSDVLRIECTLMTTGDGLTLEWSLRDRTGPVARGAPSVALATGWRSLVDSVSDQLVLAILAGPLAGDPWIPSAALPESPAALRRFLEGERSFASGQWEDALAAYLEAERADSTCLLCSYRLNDVGRWYNWSLDPGRARRLLDSAHRFPPHYRTLIEAEWLPIAERLDTLEAATLRYQDFALVWYRYGEELFHRGPLIGRLRAESAEAFRHTLRIRPDFAPAWNHLAWVSIAEGDSVEAERALDEYERLERASTGLPFVQLALITVARAWRFDDELAGPIVTAEVLGDPRLANQRLVAAGPRLLLAFQVWEGAIWLGRELAARSNDVEVSRAGLIAQTLGQLAAGRVDTATQTADRLAESVDDAGTRMFAAGLPAVVRLAESDSIRQGEAASLVDRLRAFLDPAAHRPAIRRAAGFLIGAVAIAADQPAVRSEAAGVLDGELGDGYRELLAGIAARRADLEGPSLDSALAHAPWILEEQPAARLLVKFSTARWLARQGRVESAARALRFVEHEDMIGVPVGAPQAAEVEWAIGPIARWQEAAILDRQGRDRSRLCHLLATIAKEWRRGEPIASGRARTAATRFATLRCQPAA